MQAGSDLFTEWLTERGNQSYSLHRQSLLNNITYHFLEQVFKMVVTSPTSLSSAERSTESGFKLQPRN